MSRTPYPDSAKGLEMVEYRRPRRKMLIREPEVGVAMIRRTMAINKERRERRRREASRKRLFAILRKFRIWGLKRKKPADEA